MRVLLMCASAFAVASVAAMLIFPPALSVGIALALFLTTGILWRRRQCVRLRIVLVGLFTGLFWCAGYQTVLIRPALDLAGEMVSLSGTAVDYSVPTVNGVRVSARISVSDMQTDAVVWMDTEDSLKPGDRFSMTAALVDSTQRGSYYYRAEGIYLLAYGKGQAEIIPCDHVPLRYLPRLFAHTLETALEQCVPDDMVGYAKALTTGNRSELSTLEMEKLKASGIYHALALSGMHLTTLVGTLSNLVRRRKSRALLGIPVCILFTVMTGASTSLVRACIMQCLLLVAPLVGRDTDTPTSLGIAALVLMIQNPWCIFGWGTQLSFASVAGISLFSDRFYRLLLRPGKLKNHSKGIMRIYRAAVSSLTATISATICSAPLMMVYFGMLSLVAPLTNILAGWAITWCFRGSLLTATVGMLIPGVGGVLGWLLAWGFRYVSLVAGLLANIPFGALHTDSAYAFCWVLLCYGICLLLWCTRSEKKKWVIPGCCLAGTLAACIGFSLLENTGFVFAALNVGQGQCLVARMNEQTVMIDCGGSRGEIAGDTAAAYLDEVGEQQVDLLILTHYDSDHVGGVIELLQRVDVAELMLPDHEPDSTARKEIEAVAEQHGTGIQYVKEDISVTIGGSRISVFSAGRHTSENDSSLAILLEHGKTEILVTGDMDALGEKLLLRSRNLPDVDILVAGHHGSRYSTSWELLEAVQPEIVLISVGDNSYGHPAEETLKRIADAGAVVYRTDLNGTLRLKEA